MTTVGEESPPPRHAAARALADLGLAVRVLPGCSHFAQQDDPAVLAAAVREVVAEASV